MAVGMSSSSTSSSSMVLWISDLFSSSSSTSSASFDGRTKQNDRASSSQASLRKRAPIQKSLRTQKTQEQSYYEEDTTTAIVERRSISASPGDEFVSKPAAKPFPPIKDVAVPKRRKRRHDPSNSNSIEPDHSMTTRENHSQTSGQNQQNKQQTSAVPHAPPAQQPSHAALLSNTTRSPAAAAPNVPYANTRQYTNEPNTAASLLDPIAGSTTASTASLLLGLNSQRHDFNVDFTANSSNSLPLTQSHAERVVSSISSSGASTTNMQRGGILSGVELAYHPSSFGPRSGGTGIVVGLPHPSVQQSVTDGQHHIMINNATANLLLASSNVDFASINAAAMRMRHRHATFEDLGPFSESSSDTTQHYQSDAKREVIKEPREQDILLGRGSSRFMHPANQRLRFIVETYRELYDSSLTRVEKTELTDVVMRLAKTTDDEMNGEDEPPGRFLEYRKELQGWVEIDDDRARQKVSHLFRGKPNTNLREHDKHPSP